MKKRLLLLALVFGFQTARAQFTSPNMGLHFTLNDLVTSGAVTLSGGEYLVNQDLTLETTDSLSITSNAVIKVGAGYRITVKGRLLINPPDSVKITAINPAAKFHTLRFETATGGVARHSIIRKTIVEHSSGIRVLEAGLLVDSCIVRYNERAAQSGAINVGGSVPVTVMNSKIYRNARAGVSSPANGATVIIRNNWFFENGLEPGLHPQINLGPALAGPIEITGNTIIGINSPTNRSGGIAIANLLSLPNITNFLIANNTVRLNSYGVNATGPYLNGYIKGNVLESNKVNPNAMAGGSGINLYSANALQQIVISRNIIRDNLWGVTLQSGPTVKNGPKPSMGRIGAADTADVGLNHIYNNYNNGVSGQIWDLYNNTTDSIYAQNNYWGTANLATIEDHIYHKADSSLHGFVKFDPVFVPAVSGISKDKAPNQLHLFPNPAQDVVHIALNGMVLTEKSLLRFYNALGQEVLTVQLKQKQKQFEINTQKLPAGIYSYKVENNGKLHTGKVVIAR